MKKIYISGAITNNPNYKEQFAAAEAELTAAGYETLNPAKNTVMLGTEEQLVTRYMLVDEPQWVAGVPENLTVRVRYRSRPVKCDAPEPVGDGRWLVRLCESVSAITPGQSAVFYSGNTVVGGAFIADQRGINQWIPKV